MAEQHVVGFNGMWAKPEDDPRPAGARSASSRPSAST